MQNSLIDAKLPFLRLQRQKGSMGFGTLKVAPRFSNDAKTVTRSRGMVGKSIGWKVIAWLRRLRYPVGYVADLDRHVGFKRGLNEDLKCGREFARGQPEVQYQLLDVGRIRYALSQGPWELRSRPAEDHHTVAGLWTWQHRDYGI